MPVFFYLDPELLRDPLMKGIETVTLNYTFFSECLFSSFFRLRLAGACVWRRWWRGVV